MVSSILHELNQDNSVKQFVHQNDYSPFSLSMHLGEILKGSTDKYLCPAFVLS